LSNRVTLQRQKTQTSLLQLTTDHVCKKICSITHMAMMEAIRHECEGNMSNIGATAEHQSDTSMSGNTNFTAAVDNGPHLLKICSITHGTHENINCFFYQ